MEAGEHFGESALLTNSKRTAQISVLSSDAVVFSFGKVAIVSLLGEQVQGIVEYNQIKWQLNCFRFWNSMPLDIKDLILQDFKILDYKQSVLVEK